MNSRVLTRAGYSSRSVNRFRVIRPSTAHSLATNLYTGNRANKHESSSTIESTTVRKRADTVEAGRGREERGREGRGSEGMGSGGRAKAFANKQLSGRKGPAAIGRFHFKRPMNVSSLHS